MALTADLSGSIQLKSKQQTVPILGIKQETTTPSSPAPDHTYPYAYATERLGLDTSTAHAEDTDVMEVTYAQPRDSYYDPQYTASQLAPVLDLLSSHNTEAPPPPPPLEGTDGAEAEAEANPTPPTPLNLFAFASPTALATWHQARSDLAQPAYFYTMMLEHARTADSSNWRTARPKPEERFAVRMLEATLEVEQGLADLRALLGACHRAEDGEALEELRGRVRGALEGVQ